MPPADRGGTPDKDPAAFRTIREVSEQLGVPQHVLRFWETRFPELKPLQRGGNRRYYRPGDVAFAAALHKLLHQDGYTVKGVRKLITDNGANNLVAIANGEPVVQRGRPAAQPAPAPAAAETAPALQANVTAIPLSPAPVAAPAAAADSQAMLQELLRLREGLAAALAA
ncbi:MerR family transcriptional regulator [Sandaracinobacter sp. RS1-74]|uniref:MerR family transcriptional regulator n=1 Tax=Sandaracinobacteroides sayramensis TaxID=2913411 RepID=UPI001EDBE8A8|nr:MerR family transcriptional regulator [Sandaracinobacteroides sayramensis]